MFEAGSYWLSPLPGGRYTVTHTWRQRFYDDGVWHDQIGDIEDVCAGEQLEALTWLLEKQGYARL